MAGTPLGHSVPFIVPVTGEDGHTTFRVAPEAVEVLGRVRVPIAPVAVVGKYRTGKSFLMNRLIGRQGGFEVGPTIEACTRGVWLWSEPLYLVQRDGTHIAILFMDTEGIGAAGATADHDARIFSLATLLSSLLIYNSVGAIDEEAIQSLSFIANLTKHIQVKAGAGVAEGAVAAGAVLEDAASEDSGDDLEAEDGRDSDEDDEVEGSRWQPTTGADHRAPSLDDELGVGGHSGGTVSRPSRFGATAASKRGSRVEGKGAGGGVEYVNALKAEQRKKRAAAKRAQALRLREEARRSAGMKRSEGGSAEDVEVSTFFPSFLWVLRDFSLDLHDDDGTLLSPRDYLESTLAQQEGFSTDAQARNRVRRVLTSYFKDRDCVTLVRPLEDESRLQVIDSLPEDELRPIFRAQLAEMRVHVLEELVRPKTMQGQYITGRILVGLAQAYIAAINANAVPNIGNAWQDATRVECKDALEAAFKAYVDGMEVEAPRASLPMDDTALTTCHERVRIEALDAFDAKAVGPAADRYRRDLKARIEAEWAALTAANATASDGACQRIIARLWHVHIEPNLLLASEVAAFARAPHDTRLPSPAATTGAGGRVSRFASPAAAARSPRGATLASPTAGGGKVEVEGVATWVAAVYHDWATFATDLNHLLEEYHREARGPAVHKALAAFLVTAMPNVVRAINMAREKELDARTAALCQRVANLTRDHEVMAAKVAVQEQQLAELRSERSTMAVERARAEQEARLTKEEIVSVRETLVEVEADRDSLQAKLKAEVMAHAQTRAQAAAGGGGAGMLVGLGASGASGKGGGGRVDPVAVEAALKQVVGGKGGTTTSGGMARGATTIDVKAIMGRDDTTSTTADLARLEAATKVQLKLKPGGKGGAVAAPHNVHFPDVDTSGGGGCCMVQ